MKINKSLITTIIIFILITTLITGCTTQPTGKVIKESEVIELGVITALTGKASSYGQKVFEGLEIAKEEINQNNLIKNKKINLIYEDSQGDPTQAINSLNKLINTDKVPAIIGPMTSGNVLSAAPIAENQKTLLFITIASADKIKDAGDYIFRNRVSAHTLSEYFADYAYTKRKVEKISLIYMNSANGLSYKEGFENCKRGNKSE